MPGEKPAPDAHEEAKQDAEAIASAASNVERPQEQKAAETAATQRPDAAAPPEPAEPGKRLEGVFASAASLPNYEIQLRTAHGNGRAARVGASLIPASGEMQLALLSIEPITQVAPREAQ